MTVKYAHLRCRAATRTVLRRISKSLNLFMESALGIVFFHHIPQVMEKGRQEQPIENTAEDGGKGSSEGHRCREEQDMSVLLTRPWTRWG